MVARHRQSRRTALRTIGSVGIATLGCSGLAAARGGCDGDDDGDDDDSDGSDDGDGTGGVDENDVPDGATRYVAVVDRIVDGEHVVLLLEKDDELVDQLVVSVDEFDEIAEGDVLIVDVNDGELLDYEHVPERPPGGV